MPYGIEQVTVIGAGTMGAAIAGHLANAGIAVNLLDIVPTELMPEEMDAGLSLDDPRVRNRIVQAGFARMVKARPNNLFTPATAQRIQLGNTEDDFERTVGNSDWIIEVIIERPQPKQALMARIEETAKADAIISTNTSGIPIHIINEDRSPAFKERFLGTHFFNPPRYLHLLELIPTADTASAIVERMRAFAENVLGKGVVICKDTPNFVANRLISFIQSDIIEYAIENDYTVEEVDRLTGPLLGRPRTATFRLSDIIGIDVMTLVATNLYDMIPADEEREILRGEHGLTVMGALIDNQLLGSKTGQGFYKRVEDGQGGKSFWGLDLQAAANDGELTYLELQKPRWSSVGNARDLPLEERLQAMVNAHDRAGELIWHTLSRTMAYATKRIPEIADSIVDLDNAMKWGFSWELGPFETWDALGTIEILARMEAEHITLAPWVREMVDAGYDSFYTYDGTKRLVYSPLAKEYVPIKESERVIHIPMLKRANPVLVENDSASLFDMGDDVLLLEFHSKMNAFDGDILAMMQNAIDRLHGNAAALVIGNEGANFSVGANLMLMGVAAQAQQWDELEEMVRVGQNTFLALRKAPKPVIAAPFQRVLGGGTEVCFAADRIVAHAETYMGLVEVGVGIIPGWGGCKEIVRRQISPHMHVSNGNPTPYLRQAFEAVGYAKVSTSAAEAKDLGYLDKNDHIILNKDHLLAAAKAEALHLADSGYIPPTTTGNVFAAGRDYYASVCIEVYGLLQAGYISEHDAKIANKLGRVLCGGELSAATWMDEQYFLDLERETLLSLAGEEKTQERIWYMLQNGQPLRN